MGAAAAWRWASSASRAARMWRTISLCSASSSGVNSSVSAGGQRCGGVEMSRTCGGAEEDGAELGDAPCEGVAGAALVALGEAALGVVLGLGGGGLIEAVGCCGRHGKTPEMGRWRREDLSRMCTYVYYNARKREG